MLCIIAASGQGGDFATRRATIARAAQILGVDDLARRLSATRERVERWIAGTENPPYDVWLRAVDVVIDATVRGLRGD